MKGVKMRNQLRAGIRRSIAIAMTATMVFTTMPVQGIFANESIPVQTLTDSDASQILNNKEPEAEKVAVEVFSQYGELKNVFVDKEEYEDLYTVDKDDVSTFTEEDNDEAANVPIAPKWDVKPAPSAGKYNFQYIDFINNGDDADNYCILFMGDGYTANDMDKFASDMQKIVNQLMNKAPFSDADVRNHINVRAVCCISNVSGVQENGTLAGSEPALDTFFSTTFWNAGIERLIIAHNSTRVWEIRDQYMPDATAPIVVANSSKYGGAGGSYATISTNDAAPEIAIHEFGHAGAGLADEYWELTTDNRSESYNRTSDGNPNTCKWSDLIGVNGVGLYGYDELNTPDTQTQWQQSQGWYRPHQNCEMRYLNAQFCEVCKRRLRQVLCGPSQNAVDKNAIINNANELKTYVQKIANGGSTAGKTVTLNADINLGGATIPSMNVFKGTFNGNGHTISNFTISSGNGTGFIGTLENTGVVKDLHLENVNISGGGYYTGGIAGNCKGQILGSSVTGTVRGANGVGGITGHTESGALIQNCYNRASVHSTEQVAGGIVGWGGGGTVNNNYSMGNITSDMSWKGGITGYATDTTFTNNYWLSGSASYGAQGGTVTERSATEFSNGTVTNQLNSVSNVWKQGNGYPVHSYTGQNVQQTTTTQKEEPVHDAFGVIEAENFSSNSGGVKDPNSSASGGGNLGGVTNGVSITFDKVNFSEAASSLFLRYSSPSGIASGYVEVYSDGNKVGEISLGNNGSNWETYGDFQGRLSAQIGAGVHKIMFKFITSNSAPYVCNLDYVRFIKANGDTTAPAGYTYANVSSGDQWNTIGAWSYYLGEWNQSLAYYKGGVNANDFTLQIAGNSKAMWGIQAALDNLQVTNGHQYTYTINLTSTAAGSIIHKEDVSNSTENTQGIVNGNNTLTGSFTANGERAKIILELASGINPGTEIHITGFTLKDVTPEETTQPSDGINYIDGTINTWISSGNWGLYFGDWAGTASCQYASTEQYPFIVKVNEANTGTPWLVQSSYTQDAIPGHIYRVTANVTLNQAGSIGIKEDISNNANDPVYTEIAANQATNLVGEYTVSPEANQIKVMFELGMGIQKGTTVKFNSIEIVDITPIETTTEAPKPSEVTGLSVTSPKEEAIKVTWTKTGDALTNGQKYNIYIDGSLKQSNVDCGEYTYENIAAGTHTVKVTATLNGIETSGAQAQVSVAKKIKTINGGIEINGFQINAKTHGVRTIYSVDSTINNKQVVESGIIYSLEGYANDSDMVVNSSNSYVHSYASTSKGYVDVVVSDSDIASTYLMTMKFGDRTYLELTINWKIRGYAKLSDGSYVYTDITGYKIFDIADEVYRKSGMNSATYHNYLYTDILTRVDAGYTKVDYVTPVVKPGE